MDNSKYEQLISIIEELDLPINIESVPYLWYLSNDETYGAFNTSGSFERDDHQYSFEVRDLCERDGDYWLINGDDGCGNTITHILQESLRVEEPE